MITYISVAVGWFGLVVRYYWRLVVMMIPFGHKVEHCFDGNKHMLIQFNKRDYLTFFPIMGIQKVIISHG
jgi:hypothetical protein